MLSHHRSRPRLYWLLAALCIIPPISFFASMPWLRQQPDALVFLLAGIMSTLVIAASFWLAILQDRQMDEWNRSNARFSSQWGWTAGASLVALLLALPPFRDLIVSQVATWADAPNPDQKLVLITFTAGFMTVVFAQVVCTALMSMGWTFWKSRPAREPS